MRARLSSAVSAIVLVALLSGCDSTGTGFRIASARVVPNDVLLESIGATATLETEVTDRDGDLVFGTQTTWRSSAPQVATVDASGVVLAVGPGTATVTATVTGLRIVDVTATASIQVVPIATLLGASAGTESPSIRPGN